VEDELHHRVGREKVCEGVGIHVQHQPSAAGQDIGGRGGWHAVSPSLGQFVQHVFIEQS
jgi:hypothetical protein